MPKAFIRDLLKYLPSQIIPALLGFISIPVFTRIFSPSEFGYYALVMASIMILLTLLSWLGSAVVRFCPALSDTQKTIMLRSSFWVQILSSIVIAFIAVILSRFIWSDDHLFLKLFDVGMLVFVAQSIYSLLTDLLRAQFKSGKFSLFRIWLKISGLGLGLSLAIFFHLSVIGILYGMLLGALIGLPFLIRLTLTRISLPGKIPFQLLYEMALYGMPLVVGNLGFWTLRQFDRYLIEIFYSAREVGIYSAAYAISEESIMLLGSLFMLSSGPLLATVWEKNGQEESKTLLNSITRLYILVCIPAIAGISILAKPIMELLTGAEFVCGYPMVPWIAAGAFFLG